MSGFSNISDAREVMIALFQQVDLSSLRNLRIVYSYRLTDLDWSFTVALDGGVSRITEGVLSESETIIEATSDVFDRVLSGEMSLILASLSNQARIVGSVGRVFELRAIFP